MITASNTISIKKILENQKKYFLDLENMQKRISQVENENKYLKKIVKMLLLYAENTEGHFEVLDSYNFFKVTDLNLEMAIKSKKREAVVLAFPAVADVDFLKQENEKRKQEIVDNILDDDRQDEIAKQIAEKGDRVYAELSLTANNAQTAANNAQQAANTAQNTANQAKNAAAQGIADAATANGTATKAFETAETAKNDLAELDTVVEDTFASLEAKGMLTVPPPPAPTVPPPPAPTEQEVTLPGADEVSLAHFGGKKVEVYVRGAGAIIVTPNAGPIAYASLVFNNTSTALSIQNTKGENVDLIIAVIP